MSGARRTQCQHLLVARVPRITGKTTRESLQAIVGMPQEMLDKMEYEELLNIVEDEVPRAGTIVKNILRSFNYAINILTILTSIFIASHELAFASFFFFVAQVGLLVCYGDKLEALSYQLQHQRKRLKNVVRVCAC